MGTFYFECLFEVGKNENLLFEIGKNGNLLFECLFEVGKNGNLLFEIGMNGNLLFECFIVNRHEWELLQYSVYLKQARMGTFYLSVYLKQGRMGTPTITLQYTNKEVKKKQYIKLLFTKGQNFDVVFPIVFGEGIIEIYIQITFFYSCTVRSINLFSPIIFLMGLIKID